MTDTNISKQSYFFLLEPLWTRYCGYSVTYLSLKVLCPSLLLNPLLLLSKLFLLGFKVWKEQRTTRGWTMVRTSRKMWQPYKAYFLSRKIHIKWPQALTLSNIVHWTQVKNKNRTNINDLYLPWTFSARCQVFDVVEGRHSWPSMLYHRQPGDNLDKTGHDCRPILTFGLKCYMEFSYKWWNANGVYTFNLSQLLII